MEIEGFRLLKQSNFKKQRNSHTHTHMHKSREHSGKDEKFLSAFPSTKNNLMSESAINDLL